MDNEESRSTSGEEEKDIQEVDGEMEELESLIPSGVRDIVSYKRMIELQESPIFSEENRVVLCEDDETEVDLLSPMTVIKKKIAHLPASEQDSIIKQVYALSLINAKIKNYRKKAYGTNKARPHKSVLDRVVDERSSELIEYFGKYYSTKEVHRIVHQQWGLTVAMKTLENFQKRNYTLIKKAQEDYAKDHRDIRLSHKKARLEELTMMYASLKERWEKTQSREDYKIMLQTLKLINEMVEGRQVNVAGEITHKVESTINYHVQHEIMKELTINDIIIARVAARNGINPQFLSARLHQSLYAQHSGFKKPEGDLLSQDIAYPSSMVYNWNEVQALHDKKLIEDKSFTEYEELPLEEEKASTDIKNELLDRVKRKQELSSEAQKRLDDNSK